MIFAGQGWALLHFAECAASWTELDRAAASWSWFPPALLGCLASCWMLDAGCCCVPTFYLVADIFMVVMRGPFAVAVVAQLWVRARRGGRKWARAAQPRLQTTAPCWAGLAGLGWLGWAGLGLLGW